MGTDNQITQRVSSGVPVSPRRFGIIYIFMF